MRFDFNQFVQSLDGKTTEEKLTIVKDRHYASLCELAEIKRQIREAEMGENPPDRVWLRKASQARKWQSLNVSKLQDLRGQLTKQLALEAKAKHANDRANESADRHYTACLKQAIRESVDSYTAKQIFQLAARLHLGE